MIPGWYEFTLLALAAFRIWKLIGDDVILNRPRNWAVKRLGPKLDELIVCSWCAGWWIAVAIWGAWLLTPKWATIFAVPFAMSSIVGVVGSRWSD